MNAAWLRPLTGGWDLAALLGVLFVSGCAVHRVQGEVAGVEIDAKTANAGNGGDFCPPGQAKKGNC